jgi:hypothetical protein
MPRLDTCGNPQVQPVDFHSRQSDFILVYSNSEPQDKLPLSLSQASGFVPKEDGRLLPLSSREWSVGLHSRYQHLCEEGSDGQENALPNGFLADGTL